MIAWVGGTVSSFLFALVLSIQNTFCNQIYWHLPTHQTVLHYTPTDHPPHSVLTLSTGISVSPH